MSKAELTKKSARAFLLSLLIVTNVLGCGSDDDTGNNQSLCERSCEISINAVECPNNSMSECRSNCADAYRQFSRCRSQLDSFYVCVNDLSPTSFECDANGQVALKMGMCVQESDSVKTCAT